MSTTSSTTLVRKGFAAVAVGAGLFGIAAPLAVGIQSAHAAPKDRTPAHVVVDQDTPLHRHATTTTTHRSGHVAVHVQPPLVSPPLVWGAFSSPDAIVGD